MTRAIPAPEGTRHRRFGSAGASEDPESLREPPSADARGPRAGMVKPTAEQQSVEKLFPAIAQWVRDGHIEIGDQEGFGFVVQALDEAMAALEKGLTAWFKEQ